MPANTSAPILVTRQLGKRFGERWLFDAVDLTVLPGERIAIVGDSGTGKSTLLNLLAGLALPDHGSISFAGRDYATMNDDGLTILRREQFGFVFQAFHILPHLDLARNVGLPLLLLGRNDPQRVKTMLEAVGLGERAHSMPRELSGGELQRVAIARALVHQPRLILADEPTGNLDPDNAAVILDLLQREVEASNAALLLVTHSPQAAARMDRTLRLRREGLTPVDGALY